MEANRERMLRILSKFEKKIVLKDFDGNDVDFYMYYPSVKNSEDFWEIIYAVTNQNAEGFEKNSAAQIALMKEIIPKIIKFIIKGYEQRHSTSVTPEEEQYFSIMVHTNLEDVLNAFMDMSNKMLGVGDEKKNLEAAQLQKE